LAQFQSLTHGTVAFMLPGFVAVIHENIKLDSETGNSMIRIYLGLHGNEYSRI